jgi:hypothetical protein
VTSWRALEATLDGIALRGEAIRLWWRDDDAGRDHPALDRLLELAERRALPLALAVVPRWLEPPVQAAIAASARATVLQHGYAHVSHAAPGRRPIELGGRTLDALLAELEQGRALLSDAFGATFLAVLVPPWNRVEPALLARLAAYGFCGLSTFGRRPDDLGLPGLHQVNTHLDPIDWRGSRLFIGETAALERLCAALDPAEPIGILSHHLVMDEDGWRFLDQLLEVLARHPASRLCAAGELFEAGA